jgi:hypothetical protein
VTAVNKYREELSDIHEHISRDFLALRRCPRGLLQARQDDKDGIVLFPERINGFHHGRPFSGFNRYSLSRSTASASTTVTTDAVWIDRPELCAARYPSTAAHLVDRSWNRSTGVPDAL